ncbi:helix-turn-helix domain-containing protein [Thioalkalivibrio sp.]|uniref:helix-turn-helix domain-containing protein n=1 Tax=Thioalkalivibrio sp. TaxID=2093813 RepID=UPI0035642A0E
MKQLIDLWKASAATLRQYGAEAQAAVLERCALELEQALREQRDELLTLDEAAEASGFSSEHLRRLVRTGTIPNAGRKGAPRIRRADLPQKAKAGSKPVADDYDPDADAAALLARAS